MTTPPTPTPKDLKKTLQSWGFEVFRTLPDRVLLAERVRENLLMDSGLAVLAAPGLALRVRVRAQKSDFPGETESFLEARARQQGAILRARGFVEVDVVWVPIPDPSDERQQLDLWVEVNFVRALDGLEGLQQTLGAVLELARVALPNGR